MTRDRFLHILRFLHFADSSQKPDQGEQYDPLWKLRTVFDKLNKAYAKFCNPSEHLAVDEVIVKFKGRVIFRQYIPKKGKRFGIKIYKLCNESGCTYDMRVYLGRDTLRHWRHDCNTCNCFRHLTSRVQGLGHKIFMDHFFSSPRLFWWLGQTYNKFMWDSVAQQKRYAQWLWTKTTEIEKGWCKGEG